MRVVTATPARLICRRAAAACCEGRCRSAWYGPYVMRGDGARRPAETPLGSPQWLWPDEHFQSGAVIHRLVPVWDLVEGDLAVEHLPGFDGAVEDVGEQGRDVGAGGCGSAGEGDVGCEQAAEPDGGLFVLWDADAADDAAGADDADGLLVGGHVADGFEHDVGAVAAGELADLGDSFVASFGDDVGGAELAAEVGAGGAGPSG